MRQSPLSLVPGADAASVPDGADAASADATAADAAPAVAAPAVAASVPGADAASGAPTSLLASYPPGV